MNSTVKSLLFWGALVVVAVLIWNVSTRLQRPNERQISFSEFMSSVDIGSVAPGDLLLFVDWMRRFYRPLQDLSPVELPYHGYGSPRR